MLALRWMFPRKHFHCDIQFFAWADRPCVCVCLAGSIWRTKCRKWQNTTSNAYENVSIRCCHSALNLLSACQTHDITSKNVHKFCVFIQFYLELKYRHFLSCTLLEKKQHGKCDSTEWIDAIRSVAISFYQKRHLKFARYFVGVLFYATERVSESLFLLWKSNHFNQTVSVTIFSLLPRHQMHNDIYNFCYCFFYFFSVCDRFLLTMEFFAEAFWFGGVHIQRKISLTENQMRRKNQIHCIIRLMTCSVHMSECSIVLVVAQCSCVRFSANS